MSAESSGGESDSEDASILIDTSEYVGGRTSREKSGKLVFSLVKKSWFGSLTSGIGQEREDVQCVPVEGKTLNSIKAELIRAFLTVSCENNQCFIFFASATTSDVVDLPSDSRA